MVEKKLVPNYIALPHSKFPNDWKVIKSGNLIKYIGGNAFRSEDTTATGIRWLKIANVGVETTKWEEVSYLPEEFKFSYRNYLLQLGDIVMALTRPILNNKLKIAQIKREDLPCILNQRVAKLEPGNGIEKSYVYYVCQTPGFINSMNATMAGTDPPNIGSGDLENIRIPLPPFPEQKRIAQILSTCDEAIAKTNQLIAQKELSKKWLMQNLLTGKKRLKGFNEEWKFIRFKEIYSPLREKAKTNKYKVLSVTKDGIVAQSDYFKKEIASDDTSPYLVIRRGNMVMSGLNFWMGSIDVLTHFKVGMVSPAYKTFEIINPNISEDIMMFFVRSMVMRKALIGSSVQGASIVRRNLDMEILEEWDFHLPALVEQNAIAKVLQTSNKEIELLKRKMARLVEQKKGLMQVLLTGKKRLKTD